MLLHQLKQDIQTARLSRDLAKLESLKFVVGEVERKFANPTDSVVVKIIKQSIESLQTCYTHDPKVEYSQEIELLSQYLPQQLTESELHKIIGDQVLAGLNNIGSIMKYLKQHYDGLYDGSQANSIIQLILRGNK